MIPRRFKSAARPGVAGRKNMTGREVELPEIVRRIRCRYLALDFQVLREMLLRLFKPAERLHDLAHVVVRKPHFQPVLTVIGHQ